MLALVLSCMFLTSCPVLRPTGEVECACVCALDRRRKVSSMNWLAPAESWRIHLPVKYRRRVGLARVSGGSVDAPSTSISARSAERAHSIPASWGLSAQARAKKRDQVLTLVRTASGEVAKHVNGYGLPYCFVTSCSFWICMYTRRQLRLEFARDTHSAFSTFLSHLLN